ncbi:unnamed protein product, partial [Phaeothamnion confervicola]
AINTTIAGGENSLGSAGEDAEDEGSDAAGENLAAQLHLSSGVKPPPHRGSGEKSTTAVSPGGDAGAAVFVAAADAAAAPAAAAAPGGSIGKFVPPPLSAAPAPASQHIRAPSMRLRGTPPERMSARLSRARPPTSPPVDPSNTPFDGVGSDPRAAAAAAPQASARAGSGSPPPPGGDGKSPYTTHRGGLRLNLKLKLSTGNGSAMANAAAAAATTTAWSAASSGGGSGGPGGGGGPNVNVASSNSAAASRMSYKYSDRGSLLLKRSGIRIGQRGLRADPHSPVRGPSGGSGQAWRSPDSIAENLVRLEELGHGASGCVYKALHATTLKLLAVKEIPVHDKSRRHQVGAEINTLIANRAAAAAAATAMPVPA